jgi:hypothetical protein
MPDDKTYPVNEVVIEKKAVISLAISLLPLVLLACVQFILMPLLHAENNNEAMISFGRRFLMVVLISVFIQPLAVILGTYALFKISQDDSYRGKWCAIAGIMIAVVTMAFMGYKMYRGLSHM